MADPHRSFFARWARFYERTPLFTRLLRSQQDEAIRRLALLPRERLLDLGCGTGRALGVVRGAVGADSSLEMLRQAPRGRAACALAGALPFGDGAFDALLCTNSFHHYPEPVLTLRELRRVLKPGGRAVIVDPNLHHPLGRLAVYGGEALILGMPTHLHAPLEWRSLCASAGFSQAAVQLLSGGVSVCIEARA